MHVVVFDEENEKDLEISVNNLLLDINDSDIVDIKYSVACINITNEQIYCFSCMVIIKD